MKQTLEYIVKTLVKNKETVEIKERTFPHKVIFTVITDKKDLGSVIGKGGIIADSIRNVIASMTKDNVIVKFVEKRGEA